MHILAVSPGQGFREDRWKAVLDSGIDALMIREKQMDARPLLELVRWCQAQAPSLPIWVNGRLDVALAAHCGLHAPEGYPGGSRALSRPLHDLSQFKERSGAEQLIISPVFGVPGKGPALGMDGLHRWLDALSYFNGRILALGGIDASNVHALRHPRLDGVAMIRAIWEAPRPEHVVRELRAAWE